MADSRRTNRRPFDPPPAAAAVQRGRRPWPEAPAYREPVENWWTPTRVHVMLKIYRAIAETLVEYGSPSVWNTDGVFGSGTTEPSWAHLSSVKADLDRAIDGLRPRLRSVADRYWRQCYSQAELAYWDHVSRVRITQLVDDAKEAITKNLCNALT